LNIQDKIVCHAAGNVKRRGCRDIEAELAPKINPKIRDLNFTRLA